MAIAKIQSGTNSSSTPFFDSWKEEQGNDYLEFLNGMIMQPKTVKAVTSGKGFMINFDDEFMIFVWKNSTEGKFLKQAIQEETSKWIGLSFEVSEKGKFGYSFCVDDEVEIAWTEDRWDEGIYYLEVTSGNPTPIAPNENRKFLSSIPLMNPKAPVKFAIPKRKPKP